MQPGQQPDMQQILAQAQQMQQQLMAAQAEIAATEVTGQAGGGLDTATVKGSGEIVSLVIDRLGQRASDRPLPDVNRFAAGNGREASLFAR